jgi:hypothetical protein
VGEADASPFACDSMQAVTVEKQADRILDELAAARAARESGNEGKARVCARRAAGWAVGFRFADDPSLSLPVSAYRRLQWLEIQDAIDPSLRRAAARLTARIDEDHDLPHEQDPLEDARRLVAAMLSDGTG